MERKTVEEEPQRRVTECSLKLYEEGIELVRERTRTTHSEVLEGRLCKSASTKERRCLKTFRKDKGEAIEKLSQAQGVPRIL